jgi:hypothetical protein
LDYLWKRELVALLATDPIVGKENSKAWAQIFFVGRQHLLTMLQKELRAGTSRLITQPIGG